MEAEPHSRYPIVRGDSGNVLGVVSARALLLALLRGEKLDLEKLAKAPVFVPETATGRDILEAITGELTGTREDSSATRREDG